MGRHGAGPQAPQVQARLRVPCRRRQLAAESQRTCDMDRGLDAEEYDEKFKRLAASGADVHGEAAFVASLRPEWVLDAGCGTGRVAIELARRGIKVVGTDRDPAMLAVARRAASGLDWRLGDIVTMQLEPVAYVVIVMAGNVMLFTDPGSEAALVANLAPALRAGGALVAGFSQAPGGYDVVRYDADCEAAGLSLAERWATWDRAPYREGADYHVSVHRSSVV